MRQPNGCQQVRVELDEGSFRSIWGRIGRGIQCSGKLWPCEGVEFGHLDVAFSAGRATRDLVFHATTGAVATTTHDPSTVNFGNCGPVSTVM